MIERGCSKNEKPGKIKWLWRPFIPFGEVTLIQGKTGIGKTTLMVKIMADLSRGLYPPTMYKGQLLKQRKGDPLESFYVSVEDYIEDMIVPMFILQGGDTAVAGYQNETEAHFVLTGNEIRDCVRLTGAKLIVIDPWEQSLDETPGLDNKAMIQDVKNAAKETGAAVVLCGNYINAADNLGLNAIELFDSFDNILSVIEGNRSYERMLVAIRMNTFRKERVPVIISEDEELRIGYH